MQTPEITKTLPCLKCGCDTTQTLVPSKRGASWKCSSCSMEVLGYTPKDMAKIVSEKLFGLKDKPNNINIPEDFKVFLKYQGDDADEMEASEQSVKAHVAITGELPKVGKKLFASTHGAHPMMAIPYGEVVRVEGLN